MHSIQTTPFDFIDESKEDREQSDRESTLIEVSASESNHNDLERSAADSAPKNRAPKKATRRSRRVNGKRPVLQPKVGDKAVCPPHGVAVVVAIEEHEISGARQLFYELEVVGGGARIKLPKRHVAAGNLREVIESTEVARVFRVLRRRKSTTLGMTWAKRHRAFTAQLNSGSLYEAAEVLRELYRTKVEKELSIGEMKLFDVARTLVVTELSIASGRTAEEVDGEISAIFMRRRKPKRGRGRKRS